MTDLESNVSNPDKDQIENARIGYQAAVDLWTCGEQQNWSRFNVMLLANSIIITATSLIITSRNSLCMSIALFIIGLILCGAWFLITKRGFAYQKYYTLSARELEECFLSNVVETVSRGGAFADGDSVRIKIQNRNKTLQMSRWSRRAKVETIALVTIGIFAIMYILAMGYAIIDKYYPTVLCT